jgi:hypothetical protein
MSFLKVQFFVKLSKLLMQFNLITWGMNSIKLVLRVHTNIRIIKVQ